MSPCDRQLKQEEMLQQIQNYVARATGLSAELQEDGIVVVQKVDNKSLRLVASHLEEVLIRQDHHGVSFLQVNFGDHRKILLTDTLIGFKPSVLADLEMERLPKVVTTPDIQSIFEALHEALGNMDVGMEIEIQNLRRVFESVVKGGEQVGFDLDLERQKIRRIPHITARGSA